MKIILMNRKTTLYTISVVALLFLAWSEAIACSCPDLAEPLVTKVEKEKRDSQAIFTGKVLKMTENLEEGYVSVELEVFDLWKGKLPATTTVLTGLHDGNC